MVIATSLTSICYVYKEKMVKQDTSVEPIQIHWDPIFHSFFSSFINLPWCHVRFHTKFGPDWFSRFDVNWIQTNRHPCRQAKFIYRSLNSMILCSHICIITFKFNWILYDLNGILQLCEFVWTLSSSFLVLFNRFLLIVAITMNSIRR